MTPHVPASIERDGHVWYAADAWADGSIDAYIEAATGERPDVPHAVWDLLDDPCWDALTYLGRRGWMDEPDPDMAIEVLAIRQLTGLENGSHLADLLQEVRRLEYERTYPRCFCICGRAFANLGGTLGPYMTLDATGLFDTDAHACPTCGRACAEHVRPPEAEPQLAIFGLDVA